MARGFEKAPPLLQRSEKPQPAGRALARGGLLPQDTTGVSSKPMTWSIHPPKEFSFTAESVHEGKLVDQVGRHADIRNCLNHKLNF